MARGRKPAVKVDQIADHTIGVGAIEAGKLKIPGVVLEWKSLPTWRKRGRGKWLPVERSTELGQKVLELLPDLGDKFGDQTEAEYFMMGTDSILAYISKEDYDKLIDAKRERADAALRRIKADDSVKLRETYIMRNPEDEKG